MDAGRHPLTARGLPAERHFPERLGEHPRDT